MFQKLGAITLLVRNYDEAIEFFTKKLGFHLIEDTRLSETKRWVLISPNSSKETCLLLAEASTEEQKAQIGNQTGGRVFLFLNTSDFWTDYHQMKNNGIHFVEEPRNEKYGWVVVFEDIYGNKWDLIETKDK